MSGVPSAGLPTRAGLGATGSQAGSGELALT